jgi:hypothetical protein
VSFKPSRITHRSGVSGGASVAAALPFTKKLVVIDASFIRTKSVPRSLPDNPATSEKWQ